MIVCDRCRKPEIIKNTVKINGKTYFLCSECSECVSNYIQFSFQEKKGLAKLGELFK